MDRADAERAQAEGPDTVARQLETTTARLLILSWLQQAVDADHRLVLVHTPLGMEIHLESDEVFLVDRHGITRHT